MTHVSLLPTEILDSLCTSADPQSGRFVRLPHPRTGLPSLFLVSGVSMGTIMEIQAIDATHPRSWFLDEEIIADGKLLMMLPIDPAFLLISILRVVPSDGNLGTFQPVDDILEQAASKLGVTASNAKDTSKTLFEDDILHFTALDCAKSAMSRICDFQDITPEIRVCRYSPQKVTEYLRKKVDGVLDAGVLDESKTITRGLAKDGLMEDGNERLLQAARTKAACDIVSQYISPEIRATLMESYREDFAELDAYMKKLEDEKMVVDQPVPPTKGRRKTGTDVPTEKPKRKAEKGSVGVEKLKKANINGMAKLSTFFKKA